MAAGCSRIGESDLPHHPDDADIPYPLIHARESGVRVFHLDFLEGFARPAQEESFARIMEQDGSLAAEDLGRIVEGMTGDGADEHLRQSAIRHFQREMGEVVRIRPPSLTRGPVDAIGDGRPDLDR